MAVYKGVCVAVQRPLATVVIAGLVSSKIIIRLMLPTVHVLLEERWIEQASSDVAD